MSKINYKIILIGNSGVGKTAIFHKMQSGKFYDQNISTIGVAKKNFFFIPHLQVYFWMLKIKMEKKKQNLSVFPYLILLGKKNLEQ